MSSSLAFFFPGQGSQSIGMLNALNDAHSRIRHTFDEASDALDLDLWSLVTEGPEEMLNRTENTQPAMLAAGIAVWRLWQDMGGRPATIMAGHSLGEYTALVAAGALGFADGVRLAAERGRLMQEAVPAGEGAMAALLGLSDEQVIALCAEQAQGDVLAAVNFNAPGQVVIAGQAGAVARAVDAARGAGAKRAVTLAVSVPSHCALMHPAAERLAERLADLSLALPQVPVLHNASVSAASSVEELRDLLVRQLYSPVRWVETVQVVAGQGVQSAIECGPGKVLAGLCKRIDKTLTTLPLFDPKTLETALETVNA